MHQDESDERRPLLGIDSPLYGQPLEHSSTSCPSPAHAPAIQPPGSSAMAAVSEVQPPSPASSSLHSSSSTKKRDQVFLDDQPGVTSHQVGVDVENVRPPIDYSSVGAFFASSWARFASLWTRRFILALFVRALQHSFIS